MYDNFNVKQNTHTNRAYHIKLKKILYITTMVQLPKDKLDNNYVISPLYFIVCNIYTHTHTQGREKIMHSDFIKQILSNLKTKMSLAKYCQVHM